MRRALPLLLLAAIGVLVWFALMGDAEPEARRASPPTADSGSGEEAKPTDRPASRRRRPKEASAAGDTEGELDAAPEDADLGVPWSVTVLGPDDTPAVGVGVEFTTQSLREVEGRLFPKGPFCTDWTGRVEFGSWPSEMEIEITLSCQPGDKFTLSEPDTVVRVPLLIPLEVRVVDGATGGAVAGAKVSIARPTVHVPLVSTSPGRYLVPCSAAYPGGAFEQSFRVEPPPGHALAFDRSIDVETTVSRYAKSLFVELVVRPETGLEVRVREHDGKPAVGATIQALTVAGRGHTFRAEPADENGVVEVHGLPFLRGEKVTLKAVKDGRSAAASPVTLTAPGVLESVEVTLPEKADSGGAFGGRGGGSRFFHTSGDGRRTSPTGTGRIEVYVVRHDGSPAAETMVVLMGFGRGRTDPFGRVVFTDLPEQRFRLVVLEPGFVRLAKDVELGDGESLHVTLREPAGRRATVTVLDADGAPVPYAELTVKLHSGVDYVRFDGDVQHARIFTDVYGRCELDDLSDGNVTVEARFGSRKASGTLTAAPHLTLRLDSVE